MNLYHCMVELKDPDRSLAFAAAVSEWLGILEEQQLVRGWRILRRKFGLASGPHSDFLIEIEFDSMAALEETFSSLAGMSDENMRCYEHMHSMIGSMHVGLYRPYPDPAQRERISLL